MAFQADAEPEPIKAGRSMGVTLTSVSLCGCVCVIGFLQTFKKKIRYDYLRLGDR